MRPIATPLQIASAVLLVLGGACVGEGEDARCESLRVQGVRAPLFGGSESPGVVAMSERTRASISLLLGVRGDPRLLCTGTFISREWILTAAHCRYGDEPIVQIGAELQLPSTVLYARETIVHPEQDLMLVRVDAVEDIEPIALFTKPLDYAWLNAMVQLAGFGLQQDGEIGRRQFASERIVRADSEALVVDGAGKSGACVGDSGGPLLVRGLDGGAKLAGVLTRGSEDCRGKDKYLPVYPVLSWVSSQLAADFTTYEVASCEGVSQDGLCRGGEAHWCESERVRSEKCEEGNICGWDIKHAGFRCIAAAEDSCQGIDYYGECDGEQALRCERGQLIRSDCNSCDRSCLRESASARVACLSRRLDLDW